MLCGKLKVTVPARLDATTWSVVPTMDNTPVLLMLTVLSPPDATDMPAPAVMLAMPALLTVLPSPKVIPCMATTLP